MPKDEYLLWQNRVEWKNEIKLKEKDEILTQVDAAIIQKPNRVLFDFDYETANIGYYAPRHKLAFYNLFYRNLKSDSGSALNNSKVVEAPVVFNPFEVQRSKREIQDLLFNKGYFYANVKDTLIKHKHRKVTVKYIIEPGKNYVVDSVHYLIDDQNIKNLVLMNQHNSWIKKNQPLVLTDLSKERQRLNSLIVEYGYCNFNPASISFVPDTSNKEILRNLDDPFALAILSSDSSFAQYNKAQVDVVIEKDDLLSFKKCKIKNTFIYVLDKGEVRNDTTKYSEAVYNDIVFRYKNPKINLDLISKNIFVRPEKNYSSQNNIVTQNRLNSLGFFRNIKLYFKELRLEDSNFNYLDCFIEMNLGDKYDFQYALDLFNTNNTQNGGGSSLKLSLQDNNFLGGVNKLNLNTIGGFQGNIYGFDSFRVTQYNLGFKVNLLMPKFLFFEKKVLPTRFSLPTTAISAGYDINFRKRLFQLENTNAEITYSWNTSKAKNWKLRPITVSRVRPSNISTTFQNQINSSFILTRQFQPYLIVGHGLAYEYNDQSLRANAPFNKLFKLSIEESGGLAQLVYNAVSDKSNNEIANYLRFEGEYRHYTNRKHSNWVNRSYIGLGVPYLKSLSLPISKQFAIGGANSMRAWNFSNILGPGAYKDSSSTYVLSNGDLKLELNSEFRYDIIKAFGSFMVEGANFIDVGNVWMYYKEVSRKNSEFNAARFYDDIGVAAGFGLRLDFSLMVLRVDYGVQVKKPYLSSNHGWNTNYNFFNKSWQKENTSIQVGFNYPF